MDVSDEEMFGHSSASEQITRLHLVVSSLRQATKCRHMVYIQYMLYVPQESLVRRPALFLR